MSTNVLADMPCLGVAGCSVVGIAFLITVRRKAADAQHGVGVCMMQKLTRHQQFAPMQANMVFIALHMLLSKRKHASSSTTCRITCGRLRISYSPQSTLTHCSRREFSLAFSSSPSEACALGFAERVLLRLNSREPHVPIRGFDTVELNSAIVFSTVIQNAPSRAAPSSGGAAATMPGAGKDVEVRLPERCIARVGRRGLAVRLR